MTFIGTAYIVRAVDCSGHWVALRRGARVGVAAGTTMLGMADNAPLPAHLRPIDASQWPGVVHVPQGRAAALKARRAEAAFARACGKAGIALDGGEAGLVVEHAELFARIAFSGWVGLAEGYMAGEWSTTDSQQLVDVLMRLIVADYKPKTPRVKAGVSAVTGEVPADLVSHFAGDGMSSFQGHFATGVPTTERRQVKSYARGAGRGGEAAQHLVDVTEFGAPVAAERQDLGDAQRHSVQMLLRLASVGAGTHLLEFPAGGGALALAAADQGATVDVAVADAQARRAVAERLLLAGATGAVKIDEVTGVGRYTDARRGRFDAVVSMDRLEALDPGQKASYLRSAEAMLASSGRVALQTVIRTEAFTQIADIALESLRAYVWPGLEYATSEELAKLVDRETELRIVKQTFAPAHLAASLGLQRVTFDAHLRDAAADGYDAVFRRLWVWQFALREALARLGMLDVSQVLLVRRSRRGRR